MDFKPDKARKFAEVWARVCGKNILEASNNVSILKQKAQLDVITETDKHNDDYLMQQIGKIYPDHNIHAEEEKFTPSDSEYTWVVDALDGSKHFARNFPIYAVSIALQKGKEVIIGVVYDPVSDTMFSAQKGKGATKNGRKISVSKTKSLEKSLLFLDTASVIDMEPELKSWTLEKIANLFSNIGRVRAIGVGALMICHVASGSFDGFVHVTGRGKFVDVAAALCILQEAGGTATDLENNSVFQLYETEGERTKQYICSNGLIHGNIRKLLI